MKFNFPQKYKVIAIIIFLGILTLTVHFVFGIGRVDEGYKFLPGESKAISAFINGEIKKVALKNSSSADYSFFVPTKTEAEFSSFSSYHPASMSVPAYCNNGNCEVFAGENCGNCPSDCGRCADVPGICYPFSLICSREMAISPERCNLAYPYCSYDPSYVGSCLAEADDEYTLQWIRENLPPRSVCENYLKAQDCLNADCYWYTANWDVYDYNFFYNNSFPGSPYANWLRNTPYCLTPENQRPPVYGNDFWCRWNFTNLPLSQTPNGPCGDSICDYSIGETVETCPIDCGLSDSSLPFYNRVWFCEGIGDDCISKTDRSTCNNTVGCKWVREE